MTTQRGQGGYLLLGVAGLMGLAALAGAWQAGGTGGSTGEPRRIVTLGQSLASCDPHSVGPGAKQLVCSRNDGSERRGAGLFMKPPR